MLQRFEPPASERLRSSWEPWPGSRLEPLTWTICLSGFVSDSVQKYALRDRLKHFDATVTPSLLCASGTWTMTEDMIKKHQTTQRRMMRMIIQTTRKKVRVAQTRTPRASTILLTSNVTTPTASRRTTRLNPTTKASTSTNKAATTQKANPPETSSEATIQKTGYIRGG